MSDQPASPTNTTKAGAKLENQYKPVGIAALNAAAICSHMAGKKKTN